MSSITNDQNSDMKEEEAILAWEITPLQNKLLSNKNFIIFSLHEMKTVDYKKISYVWWRDRLKQIAVRLPRNLRCCWCPWSSYNTNLIFKSTKYYTDRSKIFSERHINSTETSRKRYNVSHLQNPFCLWGRHYKFYLNSAVKTIFIV